MTKSFEGQNQILRGSQDQLSNHDFSLIVAVIAEVRAGDIFRLCEVVETLING